MSCVVDYHPKSRSAELEVASTAARIHGGGVISRRRPYGPEAPVASDLHRRPRPRRRETPGAIQARSDVPSYDQPIHIPARPGAVIVAPPPDRPPGGGGGSYAPRCPQPRR